MEPQIRFCTSADGTGIAYATLGEGPPLVRVPAWGGNQEQEWGHPEARRFWESLAQARLFVNFDHRGVGASQREVDDLWLEAQVADIAAVVDHLQLERFDLWGDNLGAVISAAYTAQHPERVSRLVLWAPYTCGEDFATPEVARSLVDLIRANWGLARRAIADVIFPSGPIDLQRWLSNTFRESVSPEIAARYTEFCATVDVRGFLPQVKAPTLILHRRRVRDIAIRAGRAAAALIPDARFVALEGDIAVSFLGDISYLEIVTPFLDEGRAQEPAPEAPEAGAFRTVLFTDVEGSTALTQRLGDANARELLREHERIVREALRSHGGSEVKTLGDGFMTSFSSATRALEFSIAMQRAFAQHNEMAEEPIRVRVGLNAGEPIAEDEDLYGTAVNLAARIAAQAKGGEILASDVVRGLVAGKRFLFADRGKRKLRGFEEPVRLYEVRWREEG
jgi:class 3 adenylate cyclase/pimeloyl-ACP methyl ester carboxylesterase